MHWVYELDSKSEAFDSLIKFFNEVVRKCDHRLKSIRTDNGTEFVNSKWMEFCNQKGVTWYRTTPHKSAQNGVAERFHRTLEECAKSMLFHAGMPTTEFWVPAFKTACYIINRLPTNALQGKSPIEAWTGKVPDYSYLRVFGCKVYYKEPTPANKLSPRSYIGTFVGYPPFQKCYNIWDGQRIIQSRDVKFCENEFLELDEEALALPSVSQHEDEEMPTSETPPPTRSTTTSKRALTSPDHLEQAIKRHSNSRELRSLTTDFAYFADCEPSSYTQAKQDPLWISSIEEELQALEDKHTWTPATLPSGRRAIACQYVFKYKRDADGNIESRKTRLVARGDLQLEGIDYSETFAPVVKYTSIRVILAIAFHRGMTLEQLDVPTGEF